MQARVEQWVRALSESGGSAIRVWPHGDGFSVHFDKRWSEPEAVLSEEDAESVFEWLERLPGVRKIGLRVHAGETSLARTRVTVRVDRAGGYPFADIELL